MLFQRVFIQKNQREFSCANNIVNETALNSEGFIMHYKGRPSN